MNKGKPFSRLQDYQLIPPNGPSPPSRTLSSAAELPTMSYLKAMDQLLSGLALNKRGIAQDFWQSVLATRPECVHDFFIARATEDICQIKRWPSELSTERLLGSLVLLDKFRNAADQKFGYYRAVTTARPSRFEYHSSPAANPDSSTVGNASSPAHNTAVTTNADNKKRADKAEIASFDDASCHRAFYYLFRSFTRCLQRSDICPLKSSSKQPTFQGSLSLSRFHVPTRLTASQIYQRASSGSAHPCQVGEPCGSWNFAFNSRSHQLSG